MKFLRKNPKDYSILLLKKYSKRYLKNSSFTSKNSSKIKNGLLGLKVLENCRIEHYQLESLRKQFLPYTRKASRIFFKGNFSVPLTKKVLGARMGKGKGKLEKWVSIYKKGEIVIAFEPLLDTLQWTKFMCFLKHKIPFNFCIVKINTTL